MDDDIDVDAMMDELSGFFDTEFERNVPALPPPSGSTDDLFKKADSRPNLPAPPAENLTPVAGIDSLPPPPEPFNVGQNGPKKPLNSDSNSEPAVAGSHDSLMDDLLASVAAQPAGARASKQEANGEQQHANEGSSSSYESEGSLSSDSDSDSSSTGSSSSRGSSSSDDEDSFEPPMRSVRLPPTKPKVPPPALPLSGPSSAPSSARKELKRVTVAASTPSFARTSPRPSPKQRHKSMHSSTLRVASPRQTGDTSDIFSHSRQKTFSSVGPSTGRKQRSMTLRVGKQPTNDSDSDENIDAKSDPLWQTFISTSTGKPYFYNTVTKETTWVRPAGFTPDGDQTKGMGGTYAVRKSRGQRDTVFFGAEVDPNTARKRKPRSVAENMKAISLTIVQPDQSSTRIRVGLDFSVLDMLDAVAEKLGLWQTDFFALCKLDSAGCEVSWLPFDSIVADLNLSEKETRLGIRVRYWKHPKKLLDPVATHLMFSQIRAEVVGDSSKRKSANTTAGGVPLSERLEFAMAVYAMQVTYGDHDPEKHRPGFFDEDSLCTLLSRNTVDMHDANYLQQRIFDLHKLLSGATRQSAEAKFLEIARESPFFGAAVFAVGEAGQPRRAAIVETGLFVSAVGDINDEEPGAGGVGDSAWSFYPLSDIVSWKETETGVVVKVDAHETALGRSGALRIRKLKFSLDRSQEFVELLCGYYWLAADQKASTHPHCRPSHQHSPPLAGPLSTPNPALFRMPPADFIVPDVEESALALFKRMLIKECLDAAKRGYLGCFPVPTPFLSIIDNHLDVAQLRVLREFDFSKMRLSAHFLTCIAKALSTAVAYKPQAGTRFVQNLDLTDLRAVRTPIIGMEYAPALGPGALPATARFAKKSPDVTVISKKKNSSPYAGAHALSLILSSGAQFKLLDLKGCKLSSSVADALRPGLQLCTSLEELIFSDNPALHTAAPILLSIVKHEGVCHLAFDNCGLTSKFGKSDLFNFFEHTVARLEQLSLSRNPLVGDAIVKALKTRRGLGVTRLDLSDCGLSRKAATELCLMVEKQQRFESLSMARCTLSDRGVSYLCSAMDNSLHVLQHVDLRQCTIGDRSMITFCDAISKSRHLQELILSGNKVKKSAATALAKSLNVANQLRELGLRDCSMVGSSIVAILRACQFMPKLSLLDLGMNPELNKTEPRTQLRSLLTSTKGLSVLYLGGAHLTPATIDALCAGISASKSLRKVFLDLNPKLPSHYRALGEAVSSGKVAHLGLRQCGASVKDIEEFFGGLGRRHKLLTVSFERDNLDKSQLRKVLRKHRDVEVVL